MTPLPGCLRAKVVNDGPLPVMCSMLGYAHFCIETSLLFHPIGGIRAKTRSRYNANSGLLEDVCFSKEEVHGLRNAPGLS